MPSRLEAQNLSIAFEAFAALGPVTFKIQSGEFVAMVGPSGCGKSTLIRAFAGLQPATQGRILLDDAPLTQPSPRVGLMFQQANLMPWRTVQENIALPLELAGVAKPERMARVADLLPVLGLEGFAGALPGTLSGGMAQRAALGRVLVHNPRVLLLDEPFGALDALTREKIGLDLLAVWAAQQQTVFMVTHDINEAVFLSDRVLVMSQRPGRIIAEVIVDLPRPRHLEQIYTPDFAALARAVRAGIDRA